MPAAPSVAAQIRTLPTASLSPNSFSISLYGNPEAETSDLIDSIRASGVLVPLVVRSTSSSWEVLSGHRRLACAKVLGLAELPCVIRDVRGRVARRIAVLDYNRQRRKTFTQLMREADALEEIHAASAERRRRANLRQFQDDPSDRRNSDDRPGRTDAQIARLLNLGGKDLYRQARAVWKAAGTGDTRASNGVAQLDAGTKSIHAAYKDLRRRNRFSADFRPTPYDVWSFKHDRAFGIPHPGSIPPGIIAHTLHYYTAPGELVVDPMAGGGTTLDVCESMGRRCLAYDIDPKRPDIQFRDVNKGLSAETLGCSLVFCDPPYHTMLAHRYGEISLSEVPLTHWIAFLNNLATACFQSLRPGGHVALLLANQTEKDIPAGVGYIDHVVHGYLALTSTGFIPERRVSCPMDGAYLPQHVKLARRDGRMLGQVRDLLVMRKPMDTTGEGRGGRPDQSSGSPHANS